MFSKIMGFAGGALSSTLILPQAAPGGEEGGLVVEDWGSVWQFANQTQDTVTVTLERSGINIGFFGEPRTGAVVMKPPSRICSSSRESWGISIANRTYYI